MSITVYESAKTRDFNLSLSKGSEISFNWFANDTSKAATETQIQAAVIAQLSFYYNGFDTLIIKNVKGRCLGGPYWEGTATYGLPDGEQSDESPGNESAGDSGDQPDPEDETVADNSFSFEIGGGTTHIVQTTRSVSQTVATGFQVAAQNGMIGVDKTGVKGCDIIDPKFEFSQTIIFEELTLGYFKNLRYLVGGVNRAKFLSFSAGELLLLGASGQYKAGSNNNPNGSWSVTFKFGVQYNQKGVVVGAAPYPVVGPFIKNGWDYVWFTYQEMLDPGGSGLTIPVAVAANVEAVYPYLNFARLGFGP